MKKNIFFMVLMVAFGTAAKAQQIDSIFFNLYTDSLKKGTHNYINVDGKMSNGRWMPLSDREVTFTSSAFQFSGNELIVPADCSESSVVVKAVLKSNPSQAIERTIWIKQKPDPDLPPYDGQRPARTTRDRKHSH